MLMPFQGEENGKEIPTVTMAIPVDFAFLQMIIHGLLLDHIAIVPVSKVVLFVIPVYTLKFSR